MFKAGQRVTYIPYKDAKEQFHEKGIVKRVKEDGTGAFVVFHCAGEWKSYQDYTAALCNNEYLIAGW